MKHSAEISDPLDHLSRNPTREEAGYYVDGGLSPYAIASLQPVKNYLAQRHTGEPLGDYIKRRSNESPDDFTHLVTDGVPQLRSIDTITSTPKHTLVQLGRRVLHGLVSRKTS